jgi:hypothetical protein
MKKVLLLALLFVSVFAFGQKDVTKFLGIPVDGTKAAMKQKLIAKGYTPRTDMEGNEYLEGEFNGTNVNIHIVTNNNKVYRIMVTDKNVLDEANIRIRFNKLVSQFKENKRYVSMGNYTLPESEDISYEMMVHNKVYEAAFYQAPDMQQFDTLAFRQMAYNEMLKNYTEEQMMNPTEEIEKEWSRIVTEKTFDYIEKKLVWFRILEQYGKFYIVMYYDNEYNHANGEDL